jgi:hypothetical protein
MEGASMTDENMTARAPGDLGALIEHISAVPDQLAEAWARALDSDEVQRGIEQLEHRVSSFASAYAGEAARRESELDQPTRLSEVPLSDESLNSLPHPDAEVHWGNAETAAFASLAESMRWLREPTRVILRLPEGTEEALWDTGIFVDFRDGLALLSRVQTSRPGGTSGEHFPTWMQLLHCAHRAHAAGLPEAVCLYLRLAFHGIEEALALASRGDQVVDRPPGPTGWEGETPPTEDGMPLVGEDFASVRNAIGLLVNIVETWGRGQTLDLATTVLLADGLLQRVNEAVSRRLFGLRPPPPAPEPANTGPDDGDETVQDDG